MAEVGTGKRSYFALLLSLIIPGLGQLYLRKPGKALLVFAGVTTGLMIVYANSMPVQTWTDLKPRFEPVSAKKVKEYTVWKFKDKRELRFRPRWYFQLSGWIQTLIFYLHGISDGWLGRRGYRRRKEPQAS